jgi:ABC-type branched-subunit amino acid transport system ATPase component
MLIEHNLDFVAEICDRVATLEYGSITSWVNRESSAEPLEIRLRLEEGTTA